MISGRLLSQRGYDFSLVSGQLFHPASGAILAETSNVKGLYALKLSEPQPTAYLTSTTETSVDLWHRRLGHIPYQRMRTLANQLKIQLPEEALPTCHTCHEANIQRGVNYTPKTRATGIGDKVHGDLVGPISPPGEGGYRYFLLLTDDRTRGRWIYHLRHKSEALSCLQQHYQLIRTQANKTIKAYGLDGGTELANNATKHWAASQGISLEFTTRYTPESNGVSERSNGLVGRIARALLTGAPEVDIAWWPEATRAAVYLLNRLPSISLGTQTPLDAFSWLVNGDGSNSDDFFTNYSGLRVWGCRVTCHIPREVRQRGEKFSPRGETGRLVGYEGPEQYRVLLDAIKQVVVRSGRQMVFDEVSSDQLAAKDHITLQEEDIGTLLCLIPCREGRQWLLKARCQR